MLSWEKIDAIPGWFMFQSYCVWRALLDQQARVPGDLFEIGVWRGRSASVLASYRKGDEKLWITRVPTNGIVACVQIRLRNTAGGVTLRCRCG